jgi:hypothetical protein
MPLDFYLSFPKRDLTFRVPLVFLFLFFQKEKNALPLVFCFFYKKEKACRY